MRENSERWQSDKEEGQKRKARINGLKVGRAQRSKEKTERRIN